MTFLTSLLISFSAFATPITCQDYNKATSVPNASKQLNSLIEKNWAYLLQVYPEMATRLGHSEGADRWTDMSSEAIKKREEMTSCLARNLAKISRAKLKGEDLINYDLLTYRTNLAIAEFPFGSEYLAISHLSGLHLDLPDDVAGMPVRNLKDYKNIIARLEKVPFLEQQIESLLREGLKKKITPVKIFLNRVPAQFDKVVTPEIEDSPLWAPFKELKITISEKEKSEIQQNARVALKEKVFPALSKLKKFIVEEYIPGARETISWSDMPDGKAWYEVLVKASTTTPLTAKELHELGLSEVARITKEMDLVRQKADFKGDLSAFNQFLLKDRRFYFRSEEELMTAFRDLAKRIDPELPRLFKTLPRLTYGVRKIPDYKSKEAPAAYYTSGNINAGTAGYFEANAYDLNARPKWGMEAVTFHEAVPGHHFQVSLSQELNGLPEFRKYGGDTAFIEGWGLYAETLGEELGFYKDPYSKYGQLTYEMWRAVRLVVDTGIHYFGWSREKAIEYFQSKMPKTRLEAEVEVDRYITWPSQALAYKVGQLKFKELRQKAEAALGSNFDIRDFHDEVLRHGSLPMDVLERTLKNWIEVKKREAKH